MTTTAKTTVVIRSDDWEANRRFRGSVRALADLFERNPKASVKALTIVEKPTRYTSPDTVVTVRLQENI